MYQRISFRPAEDGDFAFALEVYLATMRPLTAKLMVWDEGRQTASFGHQWRLEDAQIILCDGRDVGWMQAQETESEIFIQQFFIAPAHQRNGIGSEALAKFLGKCGSDKSVSLTVLRNNPAARLYERFGFAATEEIGIKLRMERVSGSRTFVPPEKKP